MQYLLSGYANWHSKRHQQPGHLFQGRFKAKLVEDASYFWELSRYIHLNPVRGKRPLVKHPRDWPFSSYLGYVQKRYRVDWIAYSTVFDAWQGEVGGTNVENAYRRFVEAGVANPIEDPFLNSPHDWVLGSSLFVEKLRERMEPPHYGDEMPMAKKLRALPPETILALVAAHYGVDVDSFSCRRSGHISRDVAAWFARRLSTATMRELAEMFGLTNPTSLSNLMRRVEQKLRKSPALRADIKRIRESILKTKNEV